MDLDRLNRSLIVSCQPVPGGPMDSPEMVVGFALAALAGGAAGLRIESARYVAAVRAATPVPIIGIVKRDLAGQPVRITPLIEDVVALAGAGADIIAVDATRRPRSVAVADLVQAIRAAGRVPMADCAEAGDAREALAAGAEIVGSTLAGYTGGPEPTQPDLDLVAAMRRMTPRVIAEGNIRTPEQAAEALRRGAWAIVVGSAITRPEHVTGWFCAALAGVRADAARPDGQP